MLSPIKALNTGGETDFIKEIVEEIRTLILDNRKRAGTTWSLFSNEGLPSIRFISLSFCVPKKQNLD